MIGFSMCLPWYFLLIVFYWCNGLQKQAECDLFVGAVESKNRTFISMFLKLSPEHVIQRKTVLFVSVLDRLLDCSCCSAFGHCPWGYYTGEKCCPWCSADHRASLKPVPVWGLRASVHPPGYYRVSPWMYVCAVFNAELAQLQLLWKIVMMFLSLS